MPVAGADVSPELRVALGATVITKCGLASALALTSGAAVGLSAVVAAGSGTLATGSRALTRVTALRGSLA
jgi:hypothetical protein